MTFLIEENLPPELILHVLRDIICNRDIVKSKKNRGMHVRV